MKEFPMDHITISQVINEGIDVFLNALEQEGHINSEQYDTFKQYRCVVSEKKLWGRMWDFITFKNGKPNDSYFVIVKAIKPRQSSEE